MADTKKPREGVVRGDPPKVPTGAPRYRVKDKVHFINGRLVQPGEEVFYNGIPGTGLEPLDDAAKKAFAAAETERAKRKAAADEQAAANAAAKRILAGK